MRYAARKFMRTPGLTFALLLTIALGIGSNISIYAFIRGLTRPDSPLTPIDRIASIFGEDARGEAGPFSYQDYRILTSHLDRKVFEWVGAAQISPAALTTADQSAIVSVAAVTPALADALNIHPEEGAVISHRLWQEDFGGKSDIRGNQIRINGTNTHIGGVAPDKLEGLYRDRAIDLWVPFNEKALQAAGRLSRNVWVLARLRTGVSINQAKATLRPEIDVLPYTGMPPAMAEGMRRIGMLLVLAAGAVFFIACINVVSFLLGRALARSRETSLRVALGARRRQLARELLWDSVLISVAGGLSGMLLAVWTAHVVPVFLFEEDAGRLVLKPDMFSTVTMSIVCIGVTIVCGLVPVLVTSDDRPGAILQRESGGPSKAMRNLRIVFVVSQMASCCMLVISTAFLIDGLHAALETDVGHRLGDPILATVQAQPQPGGVDTGYFQQVERAVRSMVGASTIAWAGRLPGSQPTWQSFRIDPPDAPLRDVYMDLSWFTTDSFKLFTLPPKAGRLFSFRDQTCRTAVVDESAAAELFGDDSVGRIVHDSAGMPVEVIGVVARKANGNGPTIYYNYTNQSASPSHIGSSRFRVPVASELARAELDMNVVSSAYFNAMGLTLIAGQQFTDRRVSEDCRVGVVNQEAAHLYFGDKPIRAAVIDDRGVRTTIVGVVRSSPLGIFERRAEPAIYFPMWQDSLPRMTLIAGARRIKAPMLADLRRHIESVPGHGTAPVVIRMLSTHLAQTALAPLRIAVVIMGASAATALILSILGLFGALNDAARERRRELAIRITLGAQRWHVVCRVLKEGGQLAGAGILIGTLGSLLLSRWWIGVTPRANPPSVWIWLSAPLVLAFAVLIASVLPARRASMVTPLTKNQ